MIRKPCYFKKWDLVIYFFILSILFTIFGYAQSLEDSKGNKAEVYVDNKLKYVFDLEENKREYFVDTNLGGVNIEIYKMKIRVTTSNSPLKICVKQGWISNSGDTIVGIPDRLLIKVIGDSDSEVDTIIK